MRSRTLFVYAVGALSLTSALAGRASASATSGVVFRATTTANGGFVGNCLESQIVDVGDNKAFVSAWGRASGCGGNLVTVPSGYFGIKAEGFRDGSYCGATAMAYNNSPTFIFGVGGFLCSNPEGSQAFATRASGEAWNETTLSYVTLSTVMSPNQSYLSEPPTADGRGAIPAAAFTAEGLDPALVPDWVPALNREGAVAGYVRKADLLPRGDRGPASLERPIPVFDADANQMVGHMHPGVGFVPLGRSPAEMTPFEVTFELRGPTTR